VKFVDAVCVHWIETMIPGGNRSHTFSIARARAQGLECARVWWILESAGLTATTLRIQVKLCGWSHQSITSRPKVSPHQIDRTWIFGDLHFQGGHIGRRRE